MLDISLPCVSRFRSKRMATQECYLMIDEPQIQDEEINLGELLAAVWAHKIIVVLVTSASIFLSVYYIANAQKEFTANAIFQIEEGNNGIQLPSELGAIASFAGLSAGIKSSENILLERVMGREFILSISSDLTLKSDPFFNRHDPNAKDPLWKATIKKLIGWKTTSSEIDAIVEKSIIKNFREYVTIDETDGGAMHISVTHLNSQKASFYANKIMQKINELVEFDNAQTSEKRLTYLSKTLADALQDMELAQKKLKDFALQNSTAALENFLSGTLTLDELRMEQRKTKEITFVLQILEDLVKTGDLNDTSYQALRETYPLVDDVSFRRILGMSETISAWTWPDIETVNAVSITLKDRLQRLDVEISEIESNAKLYASSAEALAKLTRDVKIAEATYTVLIEQVKSQSIAAGYRPDTFKVFQYATPPIFPSAPRRFTILGFGGILGIVIGCAFAILLSSFKGVFYTRKSIIKFAKPSVALKSTSFRRLSRLPVSKLLDLLTKRTVLEVDEAEIILADKKLIYVINSGGRPTAYGTSRLLATQSSMSGRKVILCDTTGQILKEVKNDPGKENAGLNVSEIAPGIHILNQYSESIRTSFFSDKNFEKNIKNLLSSYDQVYICAKNNEAYAGLIALKSFDPAVVLLSRLRKTLKSDLKNFINIHSIGILFND